MPPMKSRAKFEFRVASFTLLTLPELNFLWISNEQYEFLHRCHPLCRHASSHHHPKCQYLQGVDYTAAVASAVRYIEGRPPTHIIDANLRSTSLDINLAPKIPQGELALSFLTDPIEVKRQGLRFLNGRHRTSVLIDEDVTGKIPVIYS